jgi:hypothetical protein
MLAKIEKWQEPPPAKQAKPLPVPDLEPKKRRGGRKKRAQKERYEQPFFHNNRVFSHAWVVVVPGVLSIHTED